MSTIFGVGGDEDHYVGNDVLVRLSRVNPDGLLCLLTDEKEGALLRIEPQ
jgi:hypothetical protein